ncbi:MAG: Alpha/Beta hydrolase protein [Monoraphidium minutum]|nr:MAG: Alpha/Beta hydrolase protein [Monoraphidium minutum]
MASGGRHVQAGPYRLWVRLAGAGVRAVLLLHGFPDDASIWEPQVEALVAAGYRVIAPNMLGYCGDDPATASDAPHDVAAYGLGTVADGLVGLMDELGVGRAAVVGHDWGAAVAWRLALSHPGRVERLAVISVGHPECGAAAGGLKQRRAWWYMFLFAHPGAEAWLTANDWALLRELLGGAGGAPPEDQETYFRRLARPGALASSLAWYRANHSPAAIASTAVRRGGGGATLAMPVLGLWPTRDGALTEAQMTGSCAFVAGGPARWRYARLEGAGHWAQRDAAGEVSRRLLAFLREDFGGAQGGGSGSGGGRAVSVDLSLPQARAKL